MKALCISKVLGDAMLITSIVWQLDAMLDSFSSCKFYQSCQLSSGLLNLCLCNLRKQCHKVVISIKFPYLPLELPALAEAYIMHQLRFPWCFLFDSIASSCQMNQLVTLIWIPSVSIYPLIQSFITWDSICIRWHPNLVSVIPNMNLSLFTKVCITPFFFPESKRWFWFFVTLPFHFFSFLLLI